jgi:hypothetical protein
VSGLFFIAGLPLLSTAALLTRLIGHLIWLTGFTWLALLGLILLIGLAVLLCHCRFSIVSRRLF